MKTVTVSEAKKNLLSMIREADEVFERYLITRNSDPKAVLLSVEEFESWLETMEILSDPKAMQEIRAAKKEIKEQKTVSLDQALEEFKD